MYSNDDDLQHKIRNGNWEYIKKITTRAKSRKQPKATNVSSVHTQRGNPAPDRV